MTRVRNRGRSLNHATTKEGGGHIGNNLKENIRKSPGETANKMEKRVCFSSFQIKEKYSTGGENLPDKEEKRSQIKKERPERERERQTSGEW
jgi:hypothetical protein